jgi:serine phosphatase RsbU (regulator of sigma subunit)/anti-sigma regulatory factor (Ser/Thr protein kinase)
MASDSLQREPLLDNPLAFAGSIALVTAVAALDLIVAGGNLTPLAGLLVLGPLVASCFLTVRQTTLIAFYAIIWAISLGSVADRLGDPEHIGIAVPTAVACLFAIYGAKRRVTVDEARESLRLTAARGEFLTRATTILNSSLNYEQTLENVATAAVPGFAQWCGVYLTDGQQLRCVATAAVESRRSRGNEAQAFADAQEVLHTGEPKIASCSTRAQAGTGIRSSMTVPVTFARRRVGVLVFGNFADRRKFTDDDFVLARRLAGRAAMSIEHSRLYSERDRIARTLQQSLLPPALPDISGMRLAAAYQPAGTGAQVGGDFYDCFALPDGTWLALIGDVQGKGVEAAILTSFVQYTLRTLSMQSDGSPADMLRRLNDVLLAHDDSGRFCTLALLTLKPRCDSQQIAATIALGGHPHPLIHRASGDIERVGQPGTLLGAVSDITVSDTRFLLSPGDTLLMFSDGLSEARNSTEGMLGDEGLGTLLRAAGHDARTVVGYIGGRVNQYVSGQASDDIAMLVCEVTDETTLLDAEMPNTPASVSRARSLIRELIEQRRLAAEVLLLAVSEMVTNAVRYGDTQPVRVRLVLSANTIRLSVINAGLPFDATAPDDPGPQSPGGRGLMLVDAISSRWGTETDDGQVTVWCELDLRRP